jgi:hypothetical protein
MKKKNHTEMLELLLRSQQETLPPQEAERLAKALAKNPELQTTAKNLAQLHDLKGEEAFAFKPFFTGRVMHRIEQLAEQKPEFASALQFAFRRLALPAFAIMLGLVVITLVSEQSLSLEAITGFSEISVDDLWTEYVLSL